MLIKKYWKKVLLAVLILFVIGGNFYLIFQKESEIDRSAKIDEWVPIKRQDLVLSKKKEGVVVPFEEEHVYYQESIGSFNEFLVREGEEVDVGTPLFEYSSVQVDQLISQYEGEIAKLEKEQEALEENIQELEYLQMDTPLDEEWMQIGSNSSIIGAQILDKELQLSKVEGEIERLEEQLSALYENQDRFVVESPIAGIVKEIKYDLRNPIITITSAEKGIKGIIHEDEIEEIEEDMEVVVTHQSGEKLDGRIIDINKNPTEDPEVGKESTYTFKVELSPIEEAVEDGEFMEEELENEAFADDEIIEDEMAADEFDDDFQIEEEKEFFEDESVDLITGTKVEMKIILDEAFDTLTVPKDAIRKGSIFVLHENGKIEKLEVEKGMEVKEVTEIFTEAEEGEFVVSAPSRLKNGMEYFTPIELRKINKESISSIGKKEIFRNIALGLLTR